MMLTKCCCEVTVADCAVWLLLVELLAFDLDVFKMRENVLGNVTFINFLLGPPDWNDFAYSSSVLVPWYVFELRYDCKSSLSLDTRRILVY